MQKLFDYLSVSENRVRLMTRLVTGAVALALIVDTCVLIVYLNRH